MPRPARAALTALLLAGSAAAAAGEPQRVLVLAGDPGLSRGLAELNLALHRVVFREVPDVELLSESLDLVWIGSPVYRAKLAALIGEEYRERPPDVVVAVGAPAVRFTLAERQALFPAARLLFGHVDRSEVAALGLPPDVAGVVSRWGIDAQLDQALQLLPETRRAIVVMGSGPVERSLEPKLRRDFARFEERVDVDWWVGVPLADLERRVARLQDGAVIVYVAIYSDDSGANHIPVDALERLARVSSVPMFSAIGHHVGLGVVGDGRVDLAAVGERLGEAAVRLLRGEPPASVGIVEALPAPPRFDARQLDRFRIPRRRLPEGSLIEFETSPWRLNRDSLIAAGVLFLLQSLLIVLLAAERVRRGRAERAEQGAKRLYAGVFESLHDRVAVLDAEGTIVAANRAWCEHAEANGSATQVGDDYLQAARCAVVNGRKDAQRTVDCLEEVLASRRSHCRVEYRFGRAGEDAWQEMDVVALGEGGSGAVVAIADVTERRNAEVRLRLALESLPVATVLAGSNGRIQFVNAETERLFGYPAEQLSGRPTAILLAESARPEYQCLHGGALEASGASPVTAGRELTGRRRDGGDMPVEVRLRAIRIGAEKLILTSILDLSARHRLEGELQRLRMEVAHHGRLAAAGEMSAAIAHELNQPLTGILTNAETARHLLANGSTHVDELLEVLADIAADGRRAAEVIARLRILLRKGPIELRPLDLNETVGQVVRLMTPELRLRNCNLDVELAPGLPPIVGDRVHLQQVVLNLVLNGVEAMAGSPPGRRYLLLRTRPSVERTVELQVKDSGPGIPPEAMPHLFEAFFTTKEHGMGMGLSIVESIVQNHGGAIEVANNPSGGATFTVRLQAVSPAEETVWARRRGVASEVS